MNKTQLREILTAIERVQSMVQELIDETSSKERRVLEDAFYDLELAKSKLDDIL